MIGSVTLKAVCEGYPEKDGRQETYKRLRSKVPLKESGYFNTEKIFETYNDTSKYAKRVHSGKLRKDFIGKLGALEVSMVCDNGYSHFGGSSTIRKDGSFSVVIYTD